MNALLTIIDKGCEALLKENHALGALAQETRDELAQAQARIAELEPTPAKNSR